MYLCKRFFGSRIWLSDLPLLPPSEQLQAEEEAAFVLENVFFPNLNECDVHELATYVNIWLEGSLHDLSREARQKQTIELLVHWLRDDYEQSHCEEIESLAADTQVRLANAIEKAANKPATQHIYGDKNEFQGGAQLLKMGLPEEFTIDDVMRCFGLAQNNSARARVFRLQKDGLVEKVDEFVDNGTTKAKYKKTGAVMI